MRILIIYLKHRHIVASKGVCLEYSNTSGEDFLIALENMKTEARNYLRLVR